MTPTLDAPMRQFREAIDLALEDDKALLPVNTKALATLLDALTAAQKNEAYFRGKWATVLEVANHFQAEAARLREQVQALQGELAEAQHAEEVYKAGAGLSRQVASVALSERDAARAELAEAQTQFRGWVKAGAEAVAEQFARVLELQAKLDAAELTIDDLRSVADMHRASAMVIGAERDAALEALREAAQAAHLLSVRAAEAALGQPAEPKPETGGQA